MPELEPVSDENEGWGDRLCQEINAVMERYGATGYVACAVGLNKGNLKAPHVSAHVFKAPMPTLDARMCDTAYTLLIGNIDTLRYVLLGGAAVAKFPHLYPQYRPPSEDADLEEEADA